jgi:SAM-dependent methyltransferase
MQKHLDLGCGDQPFNPYQYPTVSGVDLYRSEKLPNNIEFKIVNLSTDKIPFNDNSFDSISAFDLLEHIPRVLQNKQGQTYFPFIELMNEVFRVLKPDGRFYALTPAYPRGEAFQDPTHVNIITNKTHTYFCGNKPYARAYGYIGNLEILRVEWIHSKNATTAKWSFRKTLRVIARYATLKRKTHLLWELRAKKPNGF